jgi:DNA gyrase subunit A
VWADTRDDVAFFTASGLAATVPLHQLAGDQNTAVNSLTGLPQDEKLVGALVLPLQIGEEDQPEPLITLATRGGRIKRITLEDFGPARRGVVTAINVEEADELAWVAQSYGHSDVLLATRQGKAIRFSENDVRPMGLSAAGVLAVKLAKDDAVVGMDMVEEKSFVVLITEKGYAKRTAVSNYPTQKRYGGGVQAAKLTSRSGRVAAAALGTDSQSVVMVTSKGRVTKLPIKGFHPLGRPSTGYRIREDNKDPYLDPAKHGVPVSFTTLAGTKTAAKRALSKAATPPKKKGTSKKRKPATTKKSGKKSASATQMSLPIDSTTKKRSRSRKK